MIDKVVPTTAAALDGARDLTIVSNNAGNGETGRAAP